MAQLPPPPGTPDGSDEQARTAVPLPPRFRFEATLGEGGFGTVVRANDTKLRAPVAIKTIRHDLRERNKEMYDYALARFDREAIAGARPTVRDSPYVVTVYDQVVDQAGNAFLILQFAAGGTVANRLRNGPLPIPEALRVTADAARGLMALHAADLVHRDIKPENIFFAADGRAQVGDLGIVQMSTTTFRTRIDSGSDRGHPGTPMYMSPEQANTSDLLMPEADQFSLGCVLFELVTGKRYKGIYAREREERLETMPRELAALIRRMTAAQPEDRYPGMEAVLAAIATIDLSAQPAPVAPQPVMPAPRPEPVVPVPVITQPQPVRDPQETRHLDLQPAAPVVERRRPPPSLAPPRPVRRRAVLLGIGGLAVAAGGAGFAYVNLRPDTPLQTLTGHTAPVNSLAFSRDGQTIATGSDDTTAMLWRFNGGTSYRVFTASPGKVNSSALSPDGQLLATASDDTIARLWRANDGSPLRILTPHDKSVWSVAFSPDSRTLATGSGDATIHLWNVADGASLRTLSGHTLAVYSVTFSPDGQTLATAAADGTIRLWRVADGSPIRTFPDTANGGSVYSVAFAPDGQWLATASDNRTVRLWRTDGTLVRTFSGHTGRVYSVAFSPDGQTLATGSEDTTVRLWRVSESTPMHTITGHAASVNSVAFSPDGRTLATASADTTVRLWSVR